MKIWRLLVLALALWLSAGERLLANTEALDWMPPRQGPQKAPYWSASELPRLRGLLFSPTRHSARRAHDVVTPKCHAVACTAAHHGTTACRETISLSCKRSEQQI